MENKRGDFTEMDDLRLNDVGVQREKGPRRDLGDIVSGDK